jgi:hypothetical protein
MAPMPLSWRSTQDRSSASDSARSLRLIFGGGEGTRWLRRESGRHRRRCLDRSWRWPLDGGGPSVSPRNWARARERESG